MINAYYRRIDNSIFYICSYYTYQIFKKREFQKRKREKILAISAKYALPVFPVGWLALELYHRIITNIPYETYRNAIWVLVLLLFTIYGFSIRHYTRRQVFENQEVFDK
ncbi:hypothetical protein ACFFJI_04910 [Allobacillus sp. GCM10007491]|uniref:Uncharacterized protein n=1 Tax=Allobacillus saliphilus TaxID=2912308 RepID=A0A941CX91_9BACI|nr:hypothetical protein [Allobacillus saliphilus]MBR7554088.1 hypothetical protein [Allobacillus saliphilus]